MVMAVDTEGRVFKRIISASDLTGADHGGWQEVGGQKLRMIDIGPKAVWGVNGAGEIWKKFLSDCDSGHKEVGRMCYFVVAKDYGSGRDAHYSTSTSKNFAKRVCGAVKSGAASAECNNPEQCGVPLFKQLHAVADEWDTRTGQALIKTQAGNYDVNTRIIGWGWNGMEQQHVDDFIRGRSYVICQYSI